MAYVKNTWVHGDKITAAKMNHLEDGVAGAASADALTRTNDALGLLFKLTRGQAWDIAQDNATAYQKTLPSGTHLSVLNGWGGQSIVWNQLLKVVSATDTNYGLTITTNPEQQSISISGTSTYAGGGADSNFYTSVFQNCNVTEGHKYFVASTGPIFQVYTYGNLPGQPDQRSYIATATGSGSLSYTIKPTDQSDVIAGSVINETFLCMIVDLTQMGLADIITTPEQFRAMFTADYYPYNERETMHGDVTSIVLKSAQQTTVQTLTVPAAVRALTGYGQTGSAITYNAADKTWAYTYNGVTTDITDLMTSFDNYLNEAEPGGTLTFVNSNGAGYGIPVPSQIDNYRNLSEVTP